MAEYIEREGIKKSINFFFDIRLKLTHSPIEIKQLVLDVIDGERAADVQPAPQWISVKERLPEVGKSVLVAVVINAKLNLPLRTDFTPEIHIGWLEENGKWGLQFDSADRDEITHWIPLPELPKGVIQMAEWIYDGDCMIASCCNIAYDIDKFARKDEFIYVPCKCPNCGCELRPPQD